MILNFFWVVYILFETDIFLAANALPGKLRFQQYNHDIRARTIQTVYIYPLNIIRGPKGHISCTWVQCATFFRNRPRRTFLFTDRPEKHKLGRGCWDLAPVKLRWIPFSGFRGEVENVSANQRPGRPSCFSDRPEKHKFGRGRWDLASCQVSLNSLQRFQGRSRKWLSQSEARAAIFFYRSARKTQTW